MKICFALATTLILSACATAQPKAKPYADARTIASSKLAWRQDRGIEIAEAEGHLLILRADPKINALDLLNPPETDSVTVSLLAKQRGYAAMINAAMFKPDYKTSFGYMRNFQTLNNPSFNSKLGGFLMFHPKKASFPAVKIRNKAEISNYETVFQSYRMWSKAEGILWKQGSSVFRQVGLVGVDDKSRVLFFYHPEEMDVHDLVAQILGLDLGIQGLLYLDGGYHGAFYLDSKLGDERNTGMSLPNIIGLKPAN